MDERMVKKIIVTRLSKGLVLAGFDLPKNRSTVLADRKERIDDQYKDSKWIELPELRSTYIYYDPKSGKFLLTDKDVPWQVITNIWVNFNRFDSRISIYPFCYGDERSTISMVHRSDQLDLSFSFD